MNNSNLSHYFPFLLTLSPLILFFQQIRGFFIKIFRILWKQKKIPGDFKYHFYDLLKKNSICLNLDNYFFEQEHLYSDKYNKFFYVLFKLNNFEIFLYKKFIPIFISSTSGCLKIQYLKYSFDFEKVFSKAVENRYLEAGKNMEKASKDRFYIQMVRGISSKKLSSFKNSDVGGSSRGESHSSSDKVGASDTESPIINTWEVMNYKLPNKNVYFNIDEISYGPKLTPKNKYIFTKQGKYILTQVERWLKAENWYQEHNIRWYRGMALYSRPGQGKSALILEVAKKLGIPIKIFDLSTFNNEEFEGDIDKLSNDSQIILFEDIDAVWNKRENLCKDEYNNLTFDCFINKLSGVSAIRNKFIFITTNHLEKLDEALIRDGRVDEIIEIKTLSQEEKLQMAEIMLDNNQDLVKVVMDRSEALSTAEFENKVVKLALDNFWK